MYKLNFIPSPGATPLPIYHPNGANEIDKLIIIEPAAHLEVNTAGSMHFDLMPDHPYIGNITIMKGVLELLDGSVPIFRGRVTRDAKSFYLRHQISVEGVLACLNDSVVGPFNFPEDWANDSAYKTAASSGNVVQFFLKWLLDSHNAQVGPEQQIKLGTVTVTDPNNYITRSSEGYDNTWATCKDKLFGSSLGGYFLMRYEADGNYLDYVDDFPLTNVQKVAFAENLLDLTAERTGMDLYTAILPVGKDGLTLAELPDESIDSDLVKSGAIIYSRSMEQEQGGRITKVVEFGDVTEAGNLRNKAAAVLAGVAMPETISCRACDLHGIDGSIPPFRVGRYTEVYSQPHGYSSTYPLLALDIDILNPGNTPIVLNRQQMSLTRSVGATATKAQVDAAKASVLVEVNQRSESFERQISGINLQMRNLLPNAKAMQDYNINGSGTIELNSEGVAIASWPAVEEVASKRVRCQPAMDFEPLRGRTVTLSWWARSADYAAINASSDQGLAYQFGIAPKGKASVYQYRFRSMYTEPLAADWRRYSVTVTLNEAFFSSGTSCWDKECDLFVDVWFKSKYRCEVTKPLLNFGTTPAYFDDAESAAAIAAAQAAAAAAQEQLNAFSSATTNTLADMQDQIDGSIVTWFENYDPTTSNAPANTWTTAALKKKHLGDIFYNSTTGHAFRWQQNGTAYEWKLIPDTDATKALADAAKAQDTADGKRRVFYTTPTPPYDKGDLWAGGATGDLKVCNTAKASGKTYAASDWVLATKYTDDALAQAAMDAFDNMEVGGRNMLPNSKTMNKWAKITTAGGVSDIGSIEIGDDGYGVYRVKAESTTRSKYVDSRPTLNYVGSGMRGKEVTLSWDARSSEASAINDNGAAEGMIGELDLCTPDGTSRRLYRLRYLYANSYPMSSGWTRYSVTFKLDDDAWSRSSSYPDYEIDEDTRIYARVYAYCYHAMEIRKIQLEIGNVPSDWTPSPEDVDERLDEVISTTKEYAAGIVNDSQEVMLEAMSKYTEQATFSSYQEEMDARLRVLNSGIEARVSRTEIQEITTAQGDVEKRVDEIEKFVSVDAKNGVTIGQKGSKVKQVLDNDSQKIYVNGQVVQELDAEDGASYSSVRIREMLTLGDLLITVESDGSTTGRRAT